MNGGDDETRRQRQPKDKPLKLLKARISAETYQWLSEMAGDASIGVLLDELREICEADEA